MSSDVAISVENLGKCYRIHHQAKRAATLAGVVKGAVASPFKYLAQRLRAPDETEIFWALKDVSFEVKRGEVIGIVGRNGAGKSTLLKILSRVTDPSTGLARIRGHVNALLEVGTGFHEELTGRENVYMNAALHGLKKTEIDRKFDEIVDFAGVEKFIDTPVKRYSSGMRVRLGFAVAANLEPDILVVDEVLAVGDLTFQRKCLGKMEAVAGVGRTVLFVSHNLALIEALCPSSIYLQEGRLVCQGPTGEVIPSYLRNSKDFTELALTERKDRTGSGEALFTGCRIIREAQENMPVNEVMLGDRIRLSMTVESTQTLSCYVGVILTDYLGRRIYYFSTRQCGFAMRLQEGSNEVNLVIPFLPVLDGKYSLSLRLTNAETHEPTDGVEEAVSFMVLSRDIFDSGVPVTSYQGIVHIAHEWETSRERITSAVGSGASTVGAHLR